MVEDSPMTGFLRNIFGLEKTESPRVQPAPPPKPAPIQSDAYKNRKKGRKEHHDSVKDLERIIACIKKRGEATPSELAKELGMARSSLTYNLNRLTTKPKFFNPYLLPHLLGKRRIERLGAGKTVRYRLVDLPPAGSP